MSGSLAQFYIDSPPSTLLCAPPANVAPLRDSCEAPTPPATARVARGAVKARRGGRKAPNVRNVSLL